MKKFLLFLLLFSTSLFWRGGEVSAQTNIYHPFPDSGASWQVECFHSVNQTNYISYYSTTGDDTIIGANTYKKIFDYSLFVGGYREDTANKKIYAVRSSTNPPYSEFLLYDFSLAVGDTFSSRPLVECDSNSIVTSIDSIIIGLTYRKRVNLVSVNIGAQISIIEGIGSVAGLFESPCFEIGCVLCEYKDDSVSYINNGYCVVGLDEEPKYVINIKISPNPSTGMFLINSSNKFQYVVYDIFGREVVALSDMPLKETTLNLSFQSKGMYFVKIKVGDKTVTRKIILH